MEYITKALDTPVAANKRLSVKGLFQIFYRPGEFFSELVTQPRILAPYLILGILLLISSMMTFGVEVGAEVERLQTENGIGLNSARIVKPLVVFGKLLLLINPLIISLVGFCLSRLPFGYVKPGFKQVLSVYLYGEVIYAAGLVLTAPLILATGDVNSSFSLAPLVLHFGYETSSDLFFLLSRFNLFFVWEIAAVGIGLSKICNCSLEDSIIISTFSVGLVSILLLLLRML